MVNLQFFSGCDDFLAEILKLFSLCNFIHSNAFGWVSKCFVAKMVVFKQVCCVCVCVDIFFREKVEFESIELDIRNVKMPICC